jgi:RNA polymerase sigma-70 factor (ECF subfamily)
VILTANVEDTALALDHFLAATEKRAYRMALIATGNSEEALDVVQDAMLKLVRKYAKRSAEEWPLLFHRILQNTLNDWYRKQKVRHGLLRWFGKANEDVEAEDPVEQLPQTGSYHPDERLGHERAMQTLEKALSDLPMRQQQAFLLRQWEGLDVANTARAMGISEGSVKTHYSRAIHSLRNQLEDHWS